MIITEEKVFEMFDAAKNVLLIEPNYRKKYPPLGLAKIKTYLKDAGKEVDFSDHILPKKYDLICVTTLFTYYSDPVLKIPKQRGFFNQNTPILFGGVFSSLMPKAFKDFENTYLFSGYSKRLDLCTPDPEIMWNIEDPWDTFSYVFTTRGCVNFCKYCPVPRIEKGLWINKHWKKVVDLSKPNLMIFDNNLSAAPIKHLYEVIDFTLEHNKKVLFENGFDVKYITKEKAKRLAELKFIRNGMRIAFDRIEEDGIFQDAAKMLIDAGVPPSNMMAYVLFNFNDKPQDSYYRARTCSDLKIRPYPQYYRPLNSLSTKDLFVGKHWTLQLGRAFRHYWLMRGINSKISFEDYIQSDDGIKNHKLEKKDIDTYKNNGV
ncbi:MAG: hypothetical protein P9L97_05635 [Candidatus Tenebribacter davisii]|nr:hypothetical protein [Candidatus Tenebribacter davisii]